MTHIKTIHFSNDAQASLLTVPTTVDPGLALQQLRVPEYKAAIFMHSGASEMQPEHVDMLDDVFEMLARFADDYDVLIADGGTNAGGMQLIGDARRKVNGKFPLLGVAVTGKVSYPGLPEDKVERYPLNNGHSHFLLVEAEDFGAESDLLIGLARAREVPTVAMVVNGGKIVEEEAGRHAKHGTPIVTIRGSYRFADELADNMTSGRIRLVYPMGTDLRIFDARKQSPGEIYDLFKELLIDSTSRE